MLSTTTTTTAAIYDWTAGIPDIFSSPRRGLKLMLGTSNERLRVRSGVAGVLVVEWA